MKPNLTLEEIYNFVDLFGEKAVKNALEGKKLKPIKYGERLPGQIEAILNKLGWDNLDPLLRNELFPDFKPFSESLFDNRGRLVPTATNICRRCYPSTEPKKRFKYGPYGEFNLDELNHAKNLLGLYFCKDTVFFDNISVANFKKRAETLVNKIKKNNRMKNILLGAYCPIIIPAIKRIHHGYDYKDYGRIFNDFYFSELIYALKSEVDLPSEYDRLGEYSFDTCISSDIHDIYLQEDSRYCDLIKIILNSRKFDQPKVGLYFLNPTQGYSVFACRGYEKMFPENYLFPGGIITSYAMMMWPNYFSHGEYTPGLNLAPLSVKKKKNYSVMFRNYGSSMSFYISTGAHAVSEGDTSPIIFVE